MQKLKALMKKNFISVARMQVSVWVGRVGYREGWVSTLKAKDETSIPNED